MTSIAWDEIGERRFETGIDRGVLYLPDTTIVPWNGLTGLDEGVSREAQPYYQDGIKYLEHHLLGEFNATLRAYTYPDEFQECIGEKISDGVTLHDQRSTPFSLSYRTMLGNDVHGVDFGYEVHILYNLYAIPNAKTFSSIADQTTPIEFSWAIGGIPKAIPVGRPTIHFSVKTTDVTFDQMLELENSLYGTNEVDPTLPTAVELVALFS